MWAPVNKINASSLYNMKSDFKVYKAQLEWVYTHSRSGEPTTTEVIVSRILFKVVDDMQSRVMKPRQAVVMFWQQLPSYKSFRTMVLMYASLFEHHELFHEVWLVHLQSVTLKKQTNNHHRN